MAQPPHPYASILIPTFDRASTLASSIRSALWQSEPNIEVIVVGDGCSAACRSIAAEAVRTDARVRFLDLPKAPFNGAANRDIAVRTARAERIFYNDDDDLLLPHHVAVLGEALDRCDVVDTPTVSVRPDGRIDLGLHDSSHPAMKTLLRDGAFKSVFDTHLAHTKAAYLRQGAPWADAPDRRSVLHMLKGFASDVQTSWHTMSRITALSFHGARRVTMPAWQRRAELERWERLADDERLEGTLRRSGSYAFHVSRMALTLRGQGFDRAAVLDLLAAGPLLEAGSGPVGRAPSRAVEDARAVVDICYRRAIWSPLVERMLVDLMGGALGARIPVHDLVRSLLPEANVAQFRDLVAAAGDASSPAEALATLACDLRLGRGPGAALARLETLADTCPPCDAYGLALEASLILKGGGETMPAAQLWCTRALGLAPPGRQALPAWTLSRDLARLRGDAVANATADAAIVDLT